MRKPSGLMKKTSAHSGPERPLVTPDEAGRRLDNYLMSRLKGVPRSRIYRMIRGGEVRINGRRARPDSRLEEGNEVRIPPVRVAATGPVQAPPADRVSWLTDRIVYEDRDLLVLNKPAGLAVHGGSGISFGAIELLRAARPDAPALELVHRLDRETSGCLIVAKRRPALRRLHEQFREGTIQKHYVTLLCGKMPGTERLIDEPLLTTQRRGGERHVVVAPEGKPARSRFTPRRRFRDATLVDVIIETGRTHQIRVHAAHIGHPVAGDERYGSADDAITRRYGLQRLFLHADRVSFDSPRGEQVIRAECPLDPELVAVVERLESAAS